MRHNLERTNGLIFAEQVALALAEQMGKSAASDWVEKACAIARHEQKPLKTVLQNLHTNLPEATLTQLFDPAYATGDCQQKIDEILQKNVHSL